MPAPDYARATDEKLWVSDETTFNTMAQPAAADAVVPLPGLSIPPAIREFSESRERQAHPSVVAIIPRKKRPSEWSLPLYLKAPNSPGTVPSYGLFLKKAFGVETISGGVSVTYALATAIEETSVSLWHSLGNLLFGTRGCLVDRVTLELSGADEGALTIEGLGANTVLAGITTVATAVLATPATGEITITVADSRPFQVGPVAATDRIKIKIDSEIFILKSLVYSTNVLTVDRAQDGSSAAAHSIGAEVIPALPGADPDGADTILPMTLGSVVLGTTTVIPRTFRQVIDNGLEARLDEYGQDTLTGFRRGGEAGKRGVTGSISGYARKTHQALLSDLERELVEDAAIIAGAATTSMARLTVNMDRLRLSNVRVVEQGNEFAFEFDYRALGTAAGNDETNWVFD